MTHSRKILAFFSTFSFIILVNQAYFGPRANTNVNRRYDRVLCPEDRIRLNEALSVWKTRAEDLTMERFYKYLTYPMQTGCNNLRRMGLGKWKTWNNSTAWDGHKYVCLDDFEFDSCLVYSFGLSHERSFERSMALFGCQVYGHDHTIKTLTGEHENFHVFKVGVGSRTAGTFKTLDDLIRWHGHERRVIHYMKVDIEADELALLPEWIKTGRLKNVLQIAFEFHYMYKNFRAYASLCRELHEEGFQLISYDPNAVIYPPPNQQRTFFPCIEVVFRRVDHQEQCYDHIM